MSWTWGAVARVPQIIRLNPVPFAAPVGMHRAVPCAATQQDGDEKLSYVEFEHIVSRAPDFSNTFRIRI